MMNFRKIYAEANELAKQAYDHAEAVAKKYQPNTADYQFNARIKLAQEIGALHATIHQLYLDQLLLKNELSELREKVEHSLN